MRDILKHTHKSHTVDEQHLLSYGPYTSILYPYELTIVLVFQIKILTEFSGNVFNHQGKVG